MDNFRGLFSIRRMDRVLNKQIRELCGVTKGADGRIDEGVLQWFGYEDRRENEGIAKRVFRSVLVVAQCLGRGRDGLKP